MFKVICQFTLNTIELKVQRTFTLNQKNFEEYTCVNDNLRDK